MQIASQPRYPMVRSMAAPSASAPQPTQAAPVAAASAPAASAPTGTVQPFSQQLGAFTQKAQSFLSNLWDTVIGPAINSLFSMIKGAFGG